MKVAAWLSGLVFLACVVFVAVAASIDDPNPSSTGGIEFFLYPALALVVIAAIWLVAFAWESGKALRRFRDRSGGA